MNKRFNICVTLLRFKVSASPINPQTVTTSIKGSNLNETFNLTRFHFHWGYNDYQGSEHLVNSKKYPLEVNLKALIFFKFRNLLY